MLLEINFTLILFAISFLIFIYLLNLTLYKPVGGVIEIRKNTIEEDYAKAKELTEKANNLLENYRTKIKEAKKEAHGIIQDSIDGAQKKKEEEVNKLLGILSKEKENAIKKIEEERQKVIKELEKEIKILSDLITSKILGGNRELVRTY